MRPRLSSSFASSRSFTVRLASLALGLACATAGCRTRLWELPEGDGGAPDLATADLARLPDLSVADLTIPPDLSFPPDLTRPHYCNGIYVFEENGNFAFFDPVQLVFHDLMPVNCPAPPNYAPFSMAVSNEGVAWVEYFDQNNFNAATSQLFTLDLTTNVCTATGFNSPGGDFIHFGMGFAADAPGSKSESLYLAGDNGQSGSNSLGQLDLKTLQIETIGPLPGRAELTGTGAGELWAFFADVETHTGRVDKQTGAINPDYVLPLGDLSASAFAFGAYGGDFYAFVAEGNSSTTVYKITNGKVTTLLANTGRHVVGAGVSTCAPVGLD